MTTIRTMMTIWMMMVILMMTAKNAMVRV